MSIKAALVAGVVMSGGVLPTASYAGTQSNAVVALHAKAVVFKGPLQVCPWG
jgi:hypothetical protein